MLRSSSSLALRGSIGGMRMLPSTCVSRRLIHALATRAALQGTAAAQQQQGANAAAFVALASTAAHAKRTWSTDAASSNQRRGVSSAVAGEAAAQHANAEPAYDESPEDARKRRTVSRWLLAISGMVAAIVIIGGLTRLTESGLSMVTWTPLGALPPITAEQWQAEFERYQQFPEYRKKNKGMTVDEFKFIFYWEYFHRQLGRLIGVSFVLPALYFWKRGHFGAIARASAGTINMNSRSWIIATFIGLQGLLGWYMVKSGLDEQHELMVKYNSVPRVSQYRLASHLGAAFVIYTALVWSYFDVKHAGTAVRRSAASMPLPPQLRTLKSLAHAIVAVVFVTAMSGAFVAGMDAGLVYNEFPKMGGRWIPSDMLALKPTLVNFFENATTVQWDHRVFATVTTALCVALLVAARRPQVYAQLPPHARLALNCLVGALVAQYTLGITTLLTYVPVSIASLHQAGSLTLFTTALWFMHCIARRKFRPLPAGAAAVA